jgi:hypothetical protein
MQIVDEEPRAAMVARLKHSAGNADGREHHLSFVLGWNPIQLPGLTRDLRGFPRPRVLMGDLNMTRPTPSRWSGLRPLGAAPSVPTDVPNRLEDRNRGWTDTSRLMAISDHWLQVTDISTGRDPEPSTSGARMAATWRM